MRSFPRGRLGVQLFPLPCLQLVLQCFSKAVCYQGVQSIHVIEFRVRCGRFRFQKAQHTFCSFKDQCSDVGSAGRVTFCAEQLRVPRILGRDRSAGWIAFTAP